MTDTVCIVGAGMMGLRTAARLEDEGIPYVLMDRKPSVGGVWSPDGGWANRSSRVQIMEPTYRLRGDDEIEQLPSDFTPRDELLEEMAKLLETLSGEVRLGCELVGVEEVSDTETVVRYTQDGEDKTLRCGEVILCTGGLQTRRQVTYEGEADFGGAIAEGNGGGPDGLDFAGKSVLILGMGAFAVENVRTCLLGGAAKVTVLTRRYNLVVSRFGIFLGFQAMNELQRGFDIAANQKKAAEMAKAAAAKAKAEAEAAAPEEDGKPGARGAAFERLARAGPDLAQLINAPYKLGGIEHVMPGNNPGGQLNTGGTIPAGNDICAHSHGCPTLAVTHAARCCRQSSSAAHSGGWRRCWARWRGWRRTASWSPSRASSFLAISS